MCDLMVHRGPDSRGIKSFGKVCLGSVRLSIIDLTEAGHMPMSDDGGRWWISYNGEVYNFKELREELIKCGHTFRSKTDTEVVLRSFIQWGEDCLDRFTGMFAFALYDRIADTVTLVRDRFGIKPMYHMQVDGHILFSSEMKCLIQASNNLRINKQSLIEWFLYRNVDVLTPDTLIEDIYSVLPGHLMTIRRRDLSSRNFYSVLSRVSQQEYERFDTINPNTVIKEIEGSLSQITRDRLVSDVPIGTLCSGGVDSSLITALAAQYSRSITAFHVSVAGYSALDEKSYAKEVAKSLGIPLISYPLTGEAFRQELPRVIYYNELPLTFPVSVPNHLICQVARQNGVIVLLSGEGADELFGGYSWRYRRLRILRRFEHFLNLLPGKIQVWAKRLALAAAGLPVTSLSFDQQIPFALGFVDRYARREWRLDCERAYSFVSNSLDRSVLGEMLADLYDFLIPQLRRLDRMSMGASTECRVPFLDHRLVEKAVNLPLAYRIGRRSDKWVLRQIASRYLPSNVANRKKFGFLLPLDDYLAPLAHADLFINGFCSEVWGLNPGVLQEFVRSWKQNIFAFFSLITCELWGRLFIRNEPLERVNELILKLEYNKSRG